MCASWGWKRRPITPPPCSTLARGTSDEFDICHVIMFEAHAELLQEPNNTATDYMWNVVDIPTSSEWMALYRQVPLRSDSV